VDDGDETANEMRFFGLTIAPNGVFDTAVYETW
jgi:hypothetical protein